MGKSYKQLADAEREQIERWLKEGGNRKLWAAWVKCWRCATATKMRSCSRVMGRSLRDCRRRRPRS